MFRTFVFSVLVLAAVSLTGCGSGYSNLHVAGQTIWGSPDLVITVKNNLVGLELANITADGQPIADQRPVSTGGEVQVHVNNVGGRVSRVVVKADVYDGDTYVGVATRRFNVYNSHYGRGYGRNSSEVWVIERFDGVGYGYRSYRSYGRMQLP